MRVSFPGQISRLKSGAFLALFLPVLGLGAQLSSVPTERQPVTNVYHGVTVVDNYQWLENAASQAVRDWTRDQNERTRGYFSKLPYREGVAQQLLQLRSEESARYSSL